MGSGNKERERSRVFEKREGGKARPVNPVLQRNFRRLTVITSRPLQLLSHYLQSQSPSGHCFYSFFLPFHFHSFNTIPPFSLPLMLLSFQAAALLVLAGAQLDWMSPCTQRVKITLTQRKERDINKHKKRINNTFGDSCVQRGEYQCIKKIVR